MIIQPRVTLPTCDKVNIEIPAGYIEIDEDSIQAGIRELREETGYISDNLVYLDSFFPSLGGSSEKIDLVLALDCEKKEEQDLDTDEYVEYIEVDFNEFEYLIDNKYMLDSNCRVAYYKVLEYLDYKYFSDIVNSLIERNKTISVMESCTGGYFTSCITNISDSSKALKYSAVTYSNEYKVKMGVSNETIDKYLVYSKECVRDMAYNICNYANANYGIGISGILKKFDDNNKTEVDDLVYICIYDYDNDKYYDYKYKVYSDKRISNKRDVSYYIYYKLMDI